MKYFNDALEKQEYYDKLRTHKKMVSKKVNPFNEFEEYSKDSIGEFLEGVYNMAMNKNEIKLSGVFIR